MVTLLQRIDFFHNFKIKRIVKYFIPILVFLSIGFVLFPSSGRDDSYITYWAAHSLAKYGEILNYNGTRVEQSSSLLQVLLLSLLHFLTRLNIVDIGKFTSILLGAITIILTSMVMSRVATRNGILASIIAATSVFFVYWSFSGLETSLVCFTILFLLLVYGDYLLLSQSRGRDIILPTLATVLYLLVRPESFLVLLSVLIALLGFVIIKNKIPKKAPGDRIALKIDRILKLLAIVILFSLAIGAIRFLYFDSVFPQPVNAKSSGIHFETLITGARYLKTNLLVWQRLLWVCLLMIGVFIEIYKLTRHPAINYHSLLSVLILTVYFMFIGFSGGDWMEGGRFIVHVLPVAVLFVTNSIYHLNRMSVISTSFLVFVVFFQVIDIFDFSSRFSTSTPIFSHLDSQGIYTDQDFSWFEKQNRINFRDIPVVIKMDQAIDRLQSCGYSNISIASGQMGMISFYVASKWFGKVEFLDMHGIVERKFTDCPLTQGYSRSSTGLDLTYKYIFDNKEELFSRCGISMPEIIFDLEIEGIDAVRDHGYSVVYWQTDDIPGDQVWLKQKKVNAGEFIAVRSDLMCE